jgi:Na+-driven multidrug efflux pump
LNLFLNWVFIFGNLGAPEMGVEGAALATLISHIAGSVILIVYSRLDKRLKLSLRLLIKPGKEITRDFFKYALPVIINETFWGLALMIYPMILGHMKNSDALHAAYNIAGSVEKIFTVAVFACGNAASVMVGNAIGAGESEESVFQTAKCLAIVSFLMGLAQALLLVLATVFLMGPVVFPLFTLSEYGAQSATVMLFLLSAVVPFRSIGFALGVGALRGGGDVKAVMIIDIATLYLVALPIGIIASRIFNSGIIGVWCVYGSILLEDLSKTLILIWRVSGKKWIRNVTRELV